MHPRASRRGRRLILTASLPWLLAGQVGCSPSAQEPVKLDLLLAGSATAGVDLADGTQLQISEARLAFGPLTFCPGSQSGALCDTARLEWRDAAVVDLLNGEPWRAGALVGNTGAVRSFMYDLGFVSLLTREDPLIMPAAEELSDASLLVRGTAEIDSLSTPVPFSLSVAARQSSDVDRGQPVVRLTSPPGLPVTITEGTGDLLIRFDLAPLLDGLASDAFLQDEECTDTGLVCQGQVAVDCASGQAVDCSLSGQICAPDAGCQDEVLIAQESAEGRGVLQRLVAGRPPDLIWD